MFKVGIIGLGNHFLEHILAAIKLSNSIEVKIICDIDQSKIKNARKYLPDVKVTTEWQKVFKAEVDGVICISFPQLHEGIIEWGIKYNIPVFVEKPPFMSSIVIEKLTKLKKQKGYKKPVGVGINFNYSVTSKIIQKIIESGEHGRVLEVDICHLSNKPNTDIWNIGNPLQTMLLSQAIHPLALMTMFMDNLGSENMAFVTTRQKDLFIVKMLLPGYKNGLPVSGTIRTGNFGPRFSSHMSITLEDGTRIECTPERVAVYQGNQPYYVGTNKWVTVWEAKPFMSGIEKGGYAQEIEEFLQAIQEKRDDGIYSPIFYYEIYKIMEKIMEYEKTRK